MNKRTPETGNPLAVPTPGPGTHARDAASEPRRDARLERLFRKYRGAPADDLLRQAVTRFRAETGHRA